MRTVSMLLVACSGAPSDTPTPVDAGVGYDARPMNPDCVAPAERFTAQASITTVQPFGDLDLRFPVALLQAPGDDDHWFVVEQPGRVKRVDVSGPQPVVETVIDVRDQVRAGGEMGLLGMAFHPDFATNGVAVLSYVDTTTTSVIATLTSPDGGASFDLSSLEPRLTIPQPYENHNGGDVAFGPDGYLYVTMGDGGAADDPQDRAQDLTSLLGKILRIDVETVDGTGYAIPPDNPYVASPFREEIWASGLRNPWRFSFDPATGELWTGDVGQNAYEEISRIEKGGNYGWRVREGFDCTALDPCDAPGLVDPVVAYGHDVGRSVIGGVVYRGTAVPELVGTYLFSDFYHGRIDGITYDADGEAVRTELVDTGLTVVDFATGNDGEVYLLDYDGGDIHRIAPAPGGPRPDFPTTLSETGCFTDGEPTDALVPYTMDHPFWSDGATKRRWLAVPDDTTIAVGADGDLELPVGSMVFKEFTVAGERVETRVFMRHDASTWAGYSYRWRDDGTDADLLLAAETVDADGTPWTIPAPATCMQCHTAAAGRTLGLELAQLQGTTTYPATGRTAPQLATWAAIDWFEAAPPPTDALPAIDAPDASSEERARAYLHVNCSMCHRPGGPGRGDLDLRRATSLADTGLCGLPQNGTLGLDDPRIVLPGDPSRSVLLERMTRRDVHRMPPIASDVVDDTAVATMADWIAEMPSCP